MLDEHMGPIKKYSILTVGAVVLALANYVFKFPNHFSFGGVVLDGELRETQIADYFST